jgi:NAD(P)-dependent dehydrogenase (short-subunit alcohol dehydrogenase family)
LLALRLWPAKPRPRTHEMTEEMFDSVYSLNVKVSYFLVVTLATLMAKRGKAAIVYLSTMLADYGASGWSR